MNEFVHHAIEQRNENDRDGRAVSFSGRDIQASNAPFVIAYGRSLEAAKAVNVGNAVNVVNAVNAVNIVNIVTVVRAVTDVTRQ